MDGDGLFGSAGVLLPMDVNPTVKTTSREEPPEMRLVSHKAFESSGAELAIHGTAHFNTCSSFGVNLALADVQLPSPGLMQGQVALRFGWFRSDLRYVRLYDPRSAWELRDVNQRQTMHQEGAEQILNWTKP